MTTPYHRAPAHDAYSRNTATFAADFDLGERIGRLPPSRSARRLRRMALLVVFAGAGSLAYAYDSAGWLPWLAGQLKTALTSATNDPQRPSEVAPRRLPPIDPANPPTAQPDAAAAPPLPDPAPAPGASPTVPATPPGAGAALPEATSPTPTPAASDADVSTDTAPAEPLPPPAVDRSDPQQVKALAAGLHPGLSHVLLTALTAADYRNAAHAITTAIAETPDTGIFIWPRQRQPEQAVFEVHFVAGAASGCRRYVVTVTKDGWSTTALPMERCGVTGAAANRARTQGAPSARPRAQ